MTQWTTSNPGPSLSSLAFPSESQIHPYRSTPQTDSQTGHKSIIRFKRPLRSFSSKIGQNQGHSSGGTFERLERLRIRTISLPTVAHDHGQNRNINHSQNHLRVPSSPPPTTIATTPTTTTATSVNSHHTISNSNRASDNQSVFSLQRLFGLGHGRNTSVASTDSTASNTTATTTSSSGFSDCTNVTTHTTTSSGSPSHSPTGWRSHFQSQQQSSGSGLSYKRTFKRVRKISKALQPSMSLSVSTINPSIADLSIPLSHAGSSGTPMSSISSSSPHPNNSSKGFAKSPISPTNGGHNLKFGERFKNWRRKRSVDLDFECRGDEIEVGEVGMNDGSGEGAPKLFVRAGTKAMEESSGSSSNRTSESSLVDPLFTSAALSLGNLNNPTIHDSSSSLESYSQKARKKILGGVTTPNGDSERSLSPADLRTGSGGEIVLESDLALNGVAPNSGGQLGTGSADNKTTKTPKVSTLNDQSLPPISFPTISSTSEISHSSKSSKHSQESHITIAQRNQRSPLMREQVESQNSVPHYASTTHQNIGPTGYTHIRSVSYHLPTDPAQYHSHSHIQHYSSSQSQSHRQPVSKHRIHLLNHHHNQSNSHHHSNLPPISKPMPIPPSQLAQRMRSTSGGTELTSQVPGGLVHSRQIPRSKPVRPPRPEKTGLEDEVEGVVEREVQSLTTLQRVGSDVVEEGKEKKIDIYGMSWFNAPLQLGDVLSSKANVSGSAGASTSASGGKKVKPPVDRSCKPNPRLYLVHKYSQSSPSLSLADEQRQIEGLGGVVEHIVGTGADKGKRVARPMDMGHKHSVSMMETPSPKLKEKFGVYQVSLEEEEEEEEEFAECNNEEAESEEDLVEEPKMKEEGIFNVTWKTRVQGGVKRDTTPPFDLELEEDDHSVKAPMGQAL